MESRPTASNFRVYELAFERFNYAVTQQKKIFGTDGVRGVANVEPVTAETALGPSQIDSQPHQAASSRR